jgi:hypothetical protein
MTHLVFFFLYNLEIILLRSLRVHFLLYILLLKGYFDVKTNLS